MPDRNSNDSMSTNDLNTPLLAEEILEKEVKPVAQEQSSSIAAASWLWLAQIALLFTSMSILVYAAKLQSHQPQNCTQKLSSYCTFSILSFLVTTLTYSQHQHYQS